MQVVGIPITERHVDYLQDVAAQLRAAGVRVEVDDSDDRMQKKIRNAQKQKVPFMLIAGDEDVAAGAVSLPLPRRDAAQRRARSPRPSPRSSRRSPSRRPGLSRADRCSRGAATPGSGSGRRTGWPTSAGESQPADTEARSAVPVLPRRTTEEALIVARGRARLRRCMNLFPYNPGHVLICPYRHVADYTDLDGRGDRRARLVHQARMMRALRDASDPRGSTSGMNQGAVAGAGIAAHLHQHVVPRWRGDSNFMTTVGGSRTMVMLLEESRDLFAAALADLD